jgi:hypothetical protein
MTLLYINPTKLNPEMLRYALGQTNNFPNIIGLSRKPIAEMLRQRRAFIRNQLLVSPHTAYALPDFNELMAAEIWQYAKRDLQPLLFHDWDAIIRETPLFQDVFIHESAELYREYQDAIGANRPFIKHRYLSITSKRKAFAKAVRDPKILAEIELACTGSTTYGLP